MNTILQKRIEEAAKTSITETLMSTPNYEFSPKATDMFECAYIKGAEDILNNQWISVEEALPEKEGRYLCNYHHKFSNSEDECDCVDFGLFKDGKWYVANNEVTHWAFIPSLEGGEK